jgi:hypothetical protein
MSAGEPGKPEASKIADHCRAIFRAGQVSPEVALDALLQTKDALRREHKFSEKELEPITELMAELESASGRGSATKPGGIP